MTATQKFHVFRTIACKRMVSLLALTVLSLFAVPASADVTTNVWTGGAGTTFWADADNWESGTPQNGQVLFFSLAQAKTFTNDLTDLAPAGIVVSNTAYVVLTFTGNALVADATDGMDILLQAGSEGPRFDLPLTGTGTVRLVCDVPNLGPIFYFDEENTQFAGRWVVDHVVLQCTNRFTVIGDDATETVIPDAITLKNGGNLKNYACDLTIPAWQGITLDETGGGFCCGWASEENPRYITVNSPITGSGPLGIAGATGTIVLNGTNTYTGGTFIGTNTWGSFVGQAGTHTGVILGDGAAIPADTPVVINGSYHGLLELNGNSIQVSSLDVLEGATLANSSATESTVTADAILMAGVLSGKVRLNGPISLEVPDSSPWTDAVYEVTSANPLDLGSNGETGSGGVTLLLNGGTVTLGSGRGFGERRTDGAAGVENDVRAIDHTNLRSGTPMDKSNWGNQSYNVGYYYQAIWYIAENGIYSFGKSFDDAAAIWIDGTRVLRNTISSAEYSTYSYRLSQGWHLLQVWLWNGKNSGGGPQHGWGNGIKWSAVNETLSANTGDIFYLTGATGTRHQFHFSAYVTRPLLIGPDGGTVAQSVYNANAFDANDTHPPVVLCGGIQETEDNTAHTPVTLTAPTLILPYGDKIPVFDAEVTLAQGASLTFSGSVLLKRMPNCAYSVTPGTHVFLTAETLSARAELTAKGAWIAYAPEFTASLFESEGNVGLATGETMVVCFLQSNGNDLLSYLPLQTGSYISEQTFTVPADAELVIENMRPWRQTGVVSGTGTVRYSGPRSFNLYNNWPDFNGTFVHEEVYHNTGSTLSGGGDASHHNGLGASAQIVMRSGIVNINNVETTATLPPLTIYGGTLQLERDVTASSITVDPTCKQWCVKDHTVSVVASAFSISSGTELSVSGNGKLEIVLNNETLRLPFLTGDLPIDVTGTGTVNIDDLRQTYGGKLSVASTVTIQTEATPAANPVIWLDASASNTLIRCATNDAQVSEWHDRRNGASGTTFPDAYLDPTMPNQSPKNGYKWAYPPDILEDATLTASPVLDFGRQNSGKWMAFTRPLMMRTVIFVIGSQNGGGPSFFSATNAPKGYCRGGSLDGDNTVTAASKIYNDATSWASPELAGSYTRTNGVVVNPKTTGLTGGYQILTTRLQSNANSLPVSGIAKDLRPLTGGHADNGKRSGGMRYAEILFYDRELTDAEITATENYLAKKWFGEVLDENAGIVYGSFGLTVSDTSTLQVDGEAAVVGLASVTGSGTLVKTGTGTIGVNDTSAFTGGIDWREGGIASGLSVAPDFWLDASVADSITEVDGRFVWRDCRWDGVTDYLVATQRWAVAPVVMTNAVGCLPVVNLGTLSHGSHDRGLQWSKSLNAQTIFMLIGSQDSGGTILGLNDSHCPFNRYEFTKASDPIYSGYTDTPIQEGQTRLNSTVINGLKTGFNGGYQVLTIRPTGPVEVGQFAHDRELSATSSRDGGQRLGEVLIFTEALDDATVVKIENYLISKWKANGDRVALQGHSLPTVSVNGDPAAVRTLTSWDELSIATLSGENDFTKAGDGGLTLNDMSGFGGRITVADGTLRIASLSRLLDQATFWVDASQGDSMVFAEGTSEVTSWRDRRGAGMYATRAATATTTKNNVEYPNLNPILLSNELNGLSVLDFGEWMSNRFLNWSKALSDIRTVFWVIGSQNGGGILLGYTGNTGIRDFYRAGAGREGGDGGNYDAIYAANPIWTRTVNSAIRSVSDAPTRLNGADVDGCTVGLSGAYDIVSVRTTANARASAFNMDRDRQWRNSTGGQRLAEVLIFSKALTAENTTCIENYLARKWGLPVTHAQETNFTTRGEIQLAGGSVTFDDYADYTLASLGGVGTASLGTNASVTVNGLSFAGTADDRDLLTVSGDLTLADGAACTAELAEGDTTLTTFAISGTLTVSGGGTLHITGAPALPRSVHIPLISASEITGFNSANWTVTSDDPSVNYQLVLDDDLLVLVPHPKGTLIFIR
ncbi:MAG: hypothetical protein IKR48_11145 [Kiritimatiellae bacterium]|nr:hypothetical protein [Kiritimatiellia bacterium]